jgi:hypothetical protein
MEQIGQAITDFQEVQISLNNAMANLENSLVGPSKTAYGNKSYAIKATLTLQKDMLVKTKEVALSARDSILETDKQIAAGLDVDISWTR